MSEIRVVAVPYELGRLRDGVGCGPERLLELGAEEALGSAGASVHIETIELDERFGRTGLGEVDAGFELIRLVAERVRTARAQGAFPVVLSGSCFSGVGTVAGLDGPAPGVVWLDAHGDFNLPETTEFGYFDGMGVSVLTGNAWQGMLATVPGASPVPEPAVILAGGQDLDEPEREALEASLVVRLTPDRLRTPEALFEAARAIGASGFYVHVDLDVISADVAPVNVYSAPGGLDGDELDELLATMLREFPVHAVSVGTYDPSCDPDGLVPPIALRLLRTVAAGL